MKSDRVAVALHRSGLGRLGRRLPLWSGILVLNHHRIGSPPGMRYDRRLWSATQVDLDRQLHVLNGHFDVIDPAELDEARRSRRGRCVLVTFDDGYRDNYELAFPMLREHRVKAAFFLTTGFLDRPRLPWWDEVSWMVRTSRRDEVRLDRYLPAVVPFDEPDRQRAMHALVTRAKTLPPDELDLYLAAIAEATGSGRPGAEHAGDMWMTWDMVRELMAGGMTIGGHTVSHPALATLSRARQEEEVGRCAKRLAEELGIAMTLFSYPYGLRSSFDAVTQDVLRTCGVRFAFSLYGGHSRFGEFDPLDIRRTSVSGAGPRFEAVVTLPQLFARW